MDITSFCENWPLYIILIITGLGSIVFFILGFFAKDPSEKEEFEGIHNAFCSLSALQSMIIVGIFCIASGIFNNSSIGLIPMIILLIIIYIWSIFAIINLISFLIGWILGLIIKSIATLFIRLIKMK